ncbi:hypothetical protein [Terriglobus albidus]|uniref:hypothetical protein n=1 Tax=Terriglobus albidus TaxID=1592106 RepID=UPI0021E0F3B2|nr:hypothetical protein [Terriglobus albidus]
MEITGLHRSLYDPALYTSHVPQRLLIWSPYLLVVILTLAGVNIILSTYRMSLINAMPPSGRLAAMGVLQVACIVSLCEIWVQNASSILRRESRDANQQVGDQTSRR